MVNPVEATARCCHATPSLGLAKQSRRHEVENDVFTRNEQVVGLQDLSEPQTGSRRSEARISPMARKKGCSLRTVSSTTPARIGPRAATSSVPRMRNQQYCSNKSGAVSGKSCLHSLEEREASIFSRWLSCYSVGAGRRKIALERWSSKDTPVACCAGTSSLDLFCTARSKMVVPVRFSRRHKTSPPHYDYPWQGFPGSGRTGTLYKSASRDRLTRPTRQRAPGNQWSRTQRAEGA